MNANRSRKGLGTGIAAIACLAVMTLGANAAVLSVGADNWAETYKAGGVTYSVDTSGALDVSFSAQGSGIPMNAEATLGAVLGVSGGSFSGDLLANGFKGISFRVLRDGAGISTVHLQLVAQNGNVWDNFSLELDGPGVWTIQNLPFTLEGGWTRMRGTQQKWQNDLQNVAMIRVRVVQKFKDAQSVRIKDFRLVGDGFVSERGVLRRLRNYFGAEVSNVDELTEEQLRKDSDRDGLADAEAIAQGKDPGVSVQIVRVADDGITVKWNGESGKRFTLRRFEGLKKGDSLRSGAGAVVTQIVDENGGDMTFTDPGATGTGPYSYRVFKE